MIKWISSPNFTVGRRGYQPEAIVIHIMAGTLAGTDSWFSQKQSQVSAHYGVGIGGQIHQYVDESDSAWHAGRRYVPTWTLIKDGVNPNLYTIGLEHEGHADDTWPEAMYDASARLVKDICLRWGIPIDRRHIVGHREIYSRKTCPGNKVDLNKLVRLAKSAATDAERYNFIKRSGKVSAIRRLNIRRGAPNVLASRVRTAKVDEGLNYTGWTSNGENVSGNSHWYRMSDGNYFWAGGTDKPTPGLS
ncbi:MAG: N-acetylmuramoyl-L-alanine amidase [Gammaproteobacteria bacterium]|nr:N-acetylmuramoyl-L-alanine amidase [Gammaproteobacteria bacterium]